MLAPTMNLESKTSKAAFWFHDLHILALKRLTIQGFPVTLSPTSVRHVANHIEDQFGHCKVMALEMGELTEGSCNTTRHGGSKDSITQLCLGICYCCELLNCIEEASKSAKMEATPAVFYTAVGLAYRSISCAMPGSQARVAR